MKRLQKAALALICTVLLTGCPNPNPSPGYYTAEPYTTTYKTHYNPTYDTEYASVFTTDSRFSFLMPAKSFMEELPDTNSLLLYNCGLKWEKSTASFSMIQRRIMDESSYIRSMDSYYGPTYFTRTDYEHTLSIPDRKQKMDMYVSITNEDSDTNIKDVLKYALNIARCEKIYPAGAADGTTPEVCINILCHTDPASGGTAVDISVTDDLGERCVLRNGIMTDKPCIPYAPEAGSLYIMPHTPQYYRDECGNNYHRQYPDPADFDVVLPFVYGDKSERYSLAALSEQMPNITEMYIPRGIDIDMKALKYMHLRTLYIYVGDMSEDELWALSDMELDRLVMFGVQSSIDMFSVSDIPHIGVYTDYYCPEANESINFAENIDELGITINSGNEMPADILGNIRRLSLYTRVSTDVGFLEQMPQLEELQICSLLNVDGLDTLKSAPLTSLDINIPHQDMTRISDISDISTLRHLTVWNACPDISSLQLDTLKVLCSDADISKLFLPSLKELYIDRYGDTDLAGIQACSGLERLTLICRNEYGFMDADISELEGLPLRSLSLGANADTSQILALDLTELSLAADFDGVRRLKNMTGLERLHLHSVNNAMLMTLADALPGCTINADIVTGDTPEEYSPYLNDGGILAVETVKERAEVTSAAFTGDEYSFVCKNDPDNEANFIFTFTNTSDEDIDYFPLLLERDGILDRYLMINVDYPSGAYEATDIESGKLLIDTQSLLLPALTTEETPDEDPTVLHPGDTAEGSFLYLE